MMYHDLKSVLIFMGIGMFILIIAGVVVGKLNIASLFTEKTNPISSPTITHPTIAVQVKPSSVPSQILQTSDITCSTVTDCPPSLGVCQPGNCPSYRCIDGRCIYFKDANAL